MLICQKPAIGLVALVVGGAIALPQNCVRAQNITVDGSLSPATTLNGPNYIIPQNSGQTAGANLFHSFGQFNLNKGESAGFESAPNIGNIFSRVTGGTPSTIEGRIYTTSPNVNFYFLNPAGIIFGSNAQIDIGSASRGSFIATTANGVGFGSSGAFVVSGAQTDTSLLKVDPSALLFNQIANASITNQGSLGVKQGQSLLLVGGEINLNGGRLLAPGGRVELAGVQGSNSINLTLSDNILLSIPEEAPRANVSLDRAFVDVSADSGGSIAITTRNLRAANGSTLIGGIGRGLGSANSKSRDIEINATGSIEFTEGSFILNSVYGQGRAGNTNISASDMVLFDGVNSNNASGGVFSTVTSRGVGNSGNIKISSGSLAVTNGAQVGIAVFGRGNGGSVDILARDSVVFDGLGRNNFASGAFSYTESQGTGGSLGINITTGNLFVKNGAQLVAGTRGRGSAGSINVVARDTVTFDGIDRLGFSSGAFSTVESGAIGDGNSINMTTNSLFLKNGAILAAYTRGQGNGGRITVNANTLEATNRGQIVTSSRSSGKAGNIILNVSNRTTFSGSDPNYYTLLAQFGDTVSDAGPTSGIFANTISGSTGQGGELTINTGLLKVNDGAQVSISSLGSGNAGSLSVNADFISLSNRGRITGETESGEGGNIKLQVQNILSLRQASTIATTAKNNGNGGNITINAPFIVTRATEDNDIIANADRGKGGRIDINATGIYGLEFRERRTLLSDINASSNITGQDGVVEIQILDENFNRGVIELPQTLLDVSQLVANSCLERASSHRSSFTVVGTSGLPTRPQDMVVSPYPTSQVRSLSENIAASNSPFKTASIMTPESAASPELIVEANGWRRDRNGHVILTAHTPTVVPGLISHACSG